MINDKSVNGIYINQGLMILMATFWFQNKRKVNLLWFEKIIYRKKKH